MYDTGCPSTVRNTTVNEISEAAIRAQEEEDGPICATRKRRRPTHRDELPGNGKQLRLCKSRFYHTGHDALRP